jgi:hypothetical protein
MKKFKVKIKSKVWLYSGASAWHFITIPKKESENIKKIFGKSARGWGSIPVKVTLGKTSWRTSIFPDRKSGTYMLPLKSEIRKKEEILAEDNVKFILEI